MANVQQVLTENNIAYTQAGSKRVLIRCTNPDHEDRNPSMAVDVVTGMGRCWSCGHKVNVFDLLGVYKDTQSIAMYTLKNKLSGLMRSQIGLAIPEDASPLNRPFRGIRPVTFNSVKAFTSPSLMDDRVIFPIYNNSGKIVAFIGRHIYSDANPKYLAYPAGSAMPLYPSKVSPVNGRVILVEGIFDALYLIDNGITNVICCFGTSAFQKGLKDKVTILKCCGVQHIQLMFDGDKAGQTSQTQLATQLQKFGFWTELIHLPEDKDPNELSVNELKELLRL